MSHTISTTHYPSQTREDGDNHVRRSGIDEGAQRRVYGGMNLGAAFFGWLTATGVAVLLTSLLAAAGSSIALTSADNLSLNSIVHNAATIGLAGGLMLLIALAISYFAGGYVAGRMSRFDGARQGVGVWIIGLLITLALGAIGAAFGAKYNALQQVNLPHIPISQGGFTKGGLIVALVTVAVTLLAAAFGGITGVKYHHKVDRAGARD
jgi:hypothetical protein